jgi:hypothetical protein
VGVNVVKVDVSKRASLPLMIRSLYLINVGWKTGYIPEEWRVAVVIHVFKEGNRDDCSNY